MIKVIFFQPYIQKWRYDFIKRFEKDTQDKYDVLSLYGKNFSNKQKGSNYNDISGINAKGLSSVPAQMTIKGQDYPVYYSPFLFIELIKQKPDVVITEGEINILNNIQIFLYTKLFSKDYLWWSLGKVRNRKENTINKILKPIIFYFLKNSKFILARNTLAKQYYLENYNIPSNKIIVVPNSLDHIAIRNEIEEVYDEFLELKEKQSEKKIIMFSGALIKGKRLEDLLYAVNKLKDRGHEIYCYIIGDGPERKILEEITRTYNLEENVEFVGAVFEGVSKYFMVADVVVLPGMGGHLIHHAMIHNKPVITRIADGVEEDLIIDGYNGYILRDYNNDKLTEAIQSVIESTQTSIDMGFNSGKIVDENWNMNIMIDNMIKAIEG